VRQEIGRAGNSGVVHRRLLYLQQALDFIMDGIRSLSAVAKERLDWSRISCRVVQRIDLLLGDGARCAP